MQPLIKLVRHGESQANVDREVWKTLGDYAIPLTPRGQEQARQAGASLGADFLRDALIYTSPYVRGRQTLQHLLEGAGLDPAQLPRYEDPRLREVDHGYDHDDQEELRRRHGWFYYRFRGGESPADCHDRTSSFLESMMRQVERKGSQRVLIVTHGLTIRCFVMRFLHLSVEEFDDMANPGNCDVVTLATPWRGAAPDPCHQRGRWSCWGLRRRPDPR